MSERIVGGGVLAAALLLNCQPVAARGVSPYLPLNLSPVVERQIEQVMILAGRPVLTRPIAAAAVLDALPEACRSDRTLCDQVRRYLQRYMRNAGVMTAGVGVALTDGDSGQSQINRRGMPLDSAWHGDVSAFYQPFDHLLLSVGAVGHEGSVEPDGSMLSAGWQYAQLDVGYRPHWLSPFTDSSMLVSTEAPTMPSVTLSSYAPLGKLEFQYEVFLAQMSQSEQISYQGTLTTGKPRLAGLHLELQPAPGYALSVNRVFQFGGGARGGNGLSDFYKALLKPQSYDNTSPGLNTDQEFGNQTAAITSQLIFPGRVPLSVYFEYAGEDNSYGDNYRLGNAALSAGVNLPRLWNQFDLTYEASEWQNAWYVHHIYQDGLVNDGRVIGHWAGDWREHGDGVGGQSHLLRLGWQRRDGQYWQLAYRTMKNEDYGAFSYQRMHEVALSHALPRNSYLIGTEVRVGQDVSGGRYARLDVSLRFDQSWFVGGDVTDANAGDADESGVQFFADAGISAAQTNTYLGDVPQFTAAGRNPDAWKSASHSAQPHLGLGARRAISSNSDLGVRLEWDRLDGHDLLSVRALDYRYRINRRVALTGFLGAGRYDLATPAYGYYGGIGVQWMDIVPRWDLVLDLRRHEKIARDKLLASDPPATPRSDMFIDVNGAALYVSRRF